MTWLRWLYPALLLGVGLAVGFGFYDISLRAFASLTLIAFACIVAMLNTISER